MTGAVRSKRPSAISAWPCRRVRRSPSCITSPRVFYLLEEGSRPIRGRGGRGARISIRTTLRRTIHAASSYIYGGAASRRRSPYRAGHAARSDAASTFTPTFSARPTWSPASTKTAATLFRERIRLSPKTDLSRAFLAVALGHLGEGGGSQTGLARADGDQSEIFLRRACRAAPLPTPGRALTVWLRGFEKAGISA